MNHQTEKYLNLLLQREKGIIPFASTIVESNIGIYNFPRGFGRKFLFSELIKQYKLNDWEKTNKHKYIVSEETYPNFQQIKKRRIFEAYKTNYTIIISDENDIISWKHSLESKQIPFINFDKKKKFKLNYDESTVILTTLKTFFFLVENYFSENAFQRLIITDPELIKSSSQILVIPKRLYFGFCWILCTQPNKITSMHSNHFIFRFIPYDLDSFVFKAIQTCQSIVKVTKEDDNLKQIYNLPNFNVIEHTYREEMFRILHGIVDNDIYKLLDIGNIKAAINKINSFEFSNENIFQYINDKIEKDIEKKEQDLDKIKFLNNNHEDLNQILNSIQVLKKKKKRFHERLEMYIHSIVCTICNNDINEPMIFYCCQQCICGSCMIHCFQNDTKSRCPFCREVVHNDDIIPLLKTKSKPKTKILKLHSKQSKQNNLLTKEMKLFDLLADLTKTKDEMVVFYCTSDEVNTKLLKFLFENEIYSVEFTGSLGERQEIFGNIQKKFYKVIIVSNYRDMIGFHFLSINNIISYTEIDNYIYKFLCSRFYRIHRTKDLNFHTFKFLSHIENTTD